MPSGGDPAPTAHGTPRCARTVDHQAYTRGQMAPDLYISADIEADGPIPGKYSMLAFGLAVAGRFDGRYFEEREPSAATFYRELQPISDNVVASAARVAALDRDRLKQEGTPPAEAMSDAARWVEDQASSDRAVLDDRGRPSAILRFLLNNDGLHDCSFLSQGALAQVAATGAARSLPLALRSVEYAQVVLTRPQTRATTPLMMRM